MKRMLGYVSVLAALCVFSQTARAQDTAAVNLDSLATDILLDSTLQAPSDSLIAPFRFSTDECSNRAIKSFNPKVFVYAEQCVRIVMDTNGSQEITNRLRFVSPVIGSPERPRRVLFVLIVRTAIFPNGEQVSACIVWFDNGFENKRTPDGVLNKYEESFCGENKAKLEEVGEYYVSAQSAEN